MNNEEIKVLLKCFASDDIHLIECEHKWCDAYGYEKSQMKKDLLDYITDLQIDNIALVKNNINSNSNYFRKIYKLQQKNKKINSKLLKDKKSFEKQMRDLEFIDNEDCIAYKCYDSLIAYIDNLITFLEVNK